MLSTCPCLLLLFSHSAFAAETDLHAGVRQLLGLTAASSPAPQGIPCVQAIVWQEVPRILCGSPDDYYVCSTYEASWNVTAQSASDPAFAPLARPSVEQTCSAFVGQNLTAVAV